jgi:hypothetical protein
MRHYVNTNVVSKRTGSVKNIPYTFGNISEFLIAILATTTHQRIDENSLIIVNDNYGAFCLLHHGDYVFGVFAEYDVTSRIFFRVNTPTSSPERERLLYRLDQQRPGRVHVPQAGGFPAARFSQYQRRVAHVHAPVRFVPAQFGQLAPVVCWTKCSWWWRPVLISGITDPASR